MSNPFDEPATKGELHELRQQFRQFLEDSNKIQAAMQERLERLEKAFDAAFGAGPN